MIMPASQPGKHAMQFFAQHARTTPRVPAVRRCARRTADSRARGRSVVLRRRQVRHVAPVEHEVIAEPRKIGVGDRGANGRLVAVAARAAARRQRIEIARRSAARRSPIPESPRRAAASARNRSAGAASPARYWPRSMRPRSPACPSRTSDRRRRRLPLAMCGPAAAQQQRGGEVLLQRRLDARLAVPAAMQWLAAQVDADRGPFLGEAQVDAQVRRRRDRRTGALRCARACDRRWRPWP